MRPTDENQRGSTRPNLMSGVRRAVGGDDNILARLERDSARIGQETRSRGAWYLAGAAIALLMVVLLAWISYDNTRNIRVQPVKRDATAAAEAAPVVSPPVVRPEAVVQAPAAPAQTVPPLVLLTPPPAAPPRPAPAIVASEEAAARPAARARPASATKAREPKTAAPSRSASRSAPAHLSAPARARKPGTGTPEAPVDTDVALLSAIIIHDASHADEKAQLDAAAACARNPERTCAPRPATAPVPTR